MSASPPAHHDALLGPASPLGLLTRAQGRPRWAWLHRGRGWVGVGCDACTEAAGTARIARLRAVPAAAPRFVGLAFAAEPQATAPWWSAFPPALAATPEALYGPLPLPRQPAPAAGHTPLPPLKTVAGTTFAQWARAVQAALDALAATRLRKVVLARVEVLRLPAPVSPVAVLAALYHRHPTAYAFLMEPQPGLAFVGATPELLARVDGAHFHTVALAGTAPRGRTPAADARLAAALLASDKERREHAWVVQAIRSAMTPLTQTLHVPPAPRLRRLPHIQHLETPIHGVLQPGVGLLDVAEALHPTPALGGTPRPEALAFIAAHEPYDRGWYAAPVGMLFPDGSGELGVAIRSALLWSDRAVLYAGAGIVLGSDPAREWAETDLKLNTMRRALQAALQAAPLGQAEEGA